MLNADSASPKLPKFSPTLKLALSTTFSRNGSRVFAASHSLIPLPAGQTGRRICVKMDLLGYDRKERKSKPPPGLPAGEAPGMREGRPGPLSIPPSAVGNPFPERDPLPRNGPPLRPPPGTWSPSSSFLLFLSLPPPRPSRAAGCIPRGTNLRSSRRKRRHRQRTKWGNGRERKGRPGRSAPAAPPPLC